MKRGSRSSSGQEIVRRFATILALTLGAGSLGTAAWADGLRILAMADPFVDPLVAAAPDLLPAEDLPLSVDRFDYSGTWARIVTNAQRRQSAYDLVAVDAGWLGEFAEAGYLANLGDLLPPRAVDPSQFLPSAWASGFVDDTLMAVPIQPHPELLMVRSDLLDRHGLTAPTSFADLFDRSDRLTALGEDGSICWNAAAGAALGQTVLHLFAAHGGAALSADYRPQFDGPIAVAVAETLQRLWARLPAGGASMAWDERIAAYARGDCAFTYIWTARVAQLARTAPTVYASSRLGAAPTLAGHPPVSPLGIWLLGVPANLPSDRLPGAVEALTRLVSPAAATAYVAHGSTAIATPLSELTADGPVPEVLTVVETLDRAGSLSTAMRPPLPEFQTITEIIGDRVHRMLTTGEEPAAALRDIQTAIADLLARNGYR